MLVSNEKKPGQKAAITVTEKTEMYAVSFRQLRSRRSSPIGQLPSQRQAVLTKVKTQKVTEAV